MNERKLNVSLGIILQYVQMAASILITLIYTPMLIKFLGKAEYGIYSLSIITVSYLNILSLGIAASYIRFFSRYKKSNDELGIKKLNGLFLLTLSILGFVALIAGLVVSTNVKIIFGNGLTSDELSLAKTLILLLSVNVAISFPASLFSSFITANEKFIFLKSINIVRTVLSPLSVILFLHLGNRSIAIVLVTIAFSIIVDILNIVFSKKRLGFKLSFKNPDKSLLKEIMIFSIWIALGTIIDQANWATGSVLLGRIRGSEDVAVFAIAIQINTLYLSLSTAISGVFAPKVHKIANEEISDKEKNEKFTKIMIDVSKIQFFVIALVYAGFVFFGKFFITIWAGPDFVEAYYASLLLLGGVSIPLIQNIGIEIQRAKNKHVFRSVTYLVLALFNILITYVTISQFGVVGGAIGTFISLIVGNVIIMNIYYQKGIGLNMLYFWIKILKVSLSLILPIIIGVVFINFYPLSDIKTFILQIIIFSFVYVLSFFIFGTSRNFKTKIIKIIRRKK